MPKPKLKLSPRHKKVLDYYYDPEGANFNKTKALRMAGYSSANKQLGIYDYPAVRAEMERREAKARDKYEISYDRIMGELARVAYSSILDYAEIQADGSLLLDFSRLTEDQARAIGEVTVETYMEGKGDGAREVKRIKVKPWNKLTALEDLVRHSGLSKEKNPMEGMVPLLERIAQAKRRVRDGS